jgi:hypothetical protein
MVITNGSEPAGDEIGDENDSVVKHSSFVGVLVHNFLVYDLNYMENIMETAKVSDEVPKSFFSHKKKE